MDDETTRVRVGVLLFAGAVLALVASLLPAVELPAATYVLVAIALFASAFLIVFAKPGRVA